MLGPNGEVIPKQAAFVKAITDPESETISAAVGAFRSGKSEPLVLGHLLHSLNYSGQNVIVGGVTVRTLERNTVPILERYCRDLGIPFEYYTSKACALVANNLWQFFGGEDASAQDKVAGMTACSTLLDETSRLHEAFFMTAIGRVQTVEGAKISIATNPGGANHWLREWLDGVPCNYFKFVLEDNPYLSPEAIALYRSMYFGHFAKQMLDGEWASPTGLVYPEYTTIDTADYDPESFTLVDVSCDWGTSTVTTGLAYGYDGKRWIAFDEYWHEGSSNPRSPEQHAEHIAMLCRPGTIVTVDPSAAALKLALQRRGLIVRDGQNDVDLGIQTMQVALYGQKLLIDAAKCPHMNREFSRYYWDTKKSEKGLDVPRHDGNEHGMDATKYWVRFRLPLTGTLVPMRKWRGL